MDIFDRYTTWFWHKNPDQRPLIVSEHLERLAQGIEGWNDWANAFLVHAHDDSVIMLESAEIDFEEAYFKNIKFPCDTCFDKATFIGDALFKNATFASNVSFVSATFTGNANFIEATFTGYAFFDQATFDCDVYFDQATFDQDAYFDKAIFTGVALFNEATFDQNAYFNNATFADGARFNETTFSGSVGFNDATFGCHAQFKNATFASNVGFNKATFTLRADFDQATFTNYAFFDQATFNCDAHFREIKSHNNLSFNNSKFNKECSFLNSDFSGVSSFKNTKFKAVPNFNYTSFKQEPHLDHIDIPFIKVNEGEGLVERYRKLKQMAKQSNDFENELKFFGFELHAKSFLETTSRPEVFFIRSYKILSDFGRSLSRPFISLLLFLFTMILINGTYIAFNNTLSEECKTSKLAFSGSVMHYTLSEASPLFKLDKEQSLALEKCLFTKKALDIRNDLWGVTHLVPTSFLLFLFGLAVRNRFRVK